MATSVAHKPKPRIRRVSEVAFRDITISTSRGPLTVIMPENSKGIETTADLDARTISVKVPGRGTTVVPFEGCKFWKYGMGVPKTQDDFESE